MRASLTAGSLILASVLTLSSGQAFAQLLISGNDEKMAWNQDGVRSLKAPGNDSVSIIDISAPASPRIVAHLPLMNTIAGPPVNVAIAPGGRMALVANSLDYVRDGENWKLVPDDKIHVIDLETSPPSVMETIKVGRQPSGLTFNRQGTMALVANRADNSVSVLSIAGKAVTVADTVSVAAKAGGPNEEPSAVAISPDGSRALVAKFAAHKVAALDIRDGKVTYTQYDMATGLWPYNVQISPESRVALVANTGNGGASDGQADTVAIIDMEATPPRVVDQVVVGDAPEGLAISPTGGYAATILLNGTGNAPRKAFFGNDKSKAVLLRIDGKSVRKISEIEVGQFAEGAAFSPDGKYLYVGNFNDGTISILRRDGDNLIPAGVLSLGNRHPASLRGATP